MKSVHRASSSYVVTQGRRRGKTLEKVSRDVRMRTPEGEESKRWKAGEGERAKSIAKEASTERVTRKVETDGRGERL